MRPESMGVTSGPRQNQGVLPKARRWRRRRQLRNPHVAGHPLAIASGITPQNVGDYMAQGDAFLVATGVNYPDDFYNLDPRRLRQLLGKIRQFGARGCDDEETACEKSGDEDWYLRHMAPNVKDSKMAGNGDGDDSADAKSIPNIWIGQKHRMKASSCWWRGQACCA